MISKFLKKFRATPIAVATTLCLGLMSPTWAATVNVHVQDGDGVALSSVFVYALTFNANGPNPDASQLGTTDASGDVSFDLAFAQSQTYTLIASARNRGPSSRSQLFNPSQPRASGAGSHTIVLDQELSGQGTIRIDATDASANSYLFGGVRVVESGKDIAFGMCATDGAGDCDMDFYVGAKDANKYDASAYDPTANIGNGGVVSSAVTDGGVTTFSLDIDAGMPPDVSARDGDESFDDHARNGSETGGGNRAVGFAKGADGRAVPWGHVELMVYQGGNYQHVRGSGVDQNGRFEFFDLTDATQYFVRHNGGCRDDGTCFKGREPAVGGPADNTAGGGDFIFDVDNVPNKMSVQLATAPVGDARLQVQVKNEEGTLIPGVHISLWPDGHPRHTNSAVAACDGSDFHSGTDESNPAYSQKNTRADTGRVLWTDLTPGNYEIHVHSPFSRDGISFNAGADRQRDYSTFHPGCSGTSEDDRFLTVETDDSISVYDGKGNEKTAEVETVDGESTITIVLPTTPAGATGVVKGKITFPKSVDLTAAPLTIVLQGQCDENGCLGGFASVTGAGTASTSRISGQGTEFDYSIKVPPTKAGVPAFYWIRVLSNYWGVVREGVGGGDDQVSFDGVTEVTRNFKMAEAGRIVGNLYKPDGSLFIPGNSATGGWLSAGVDARGENSWGHTEVKNDGSFVIGGLIPGDYELVPQFWGSGDSGYAPKWPADQVTVVANQDVKQDVNFVKGLVVALNLDTGLLPTLKQSRDDNFGSWRGEQYMVKMVPAGTPLMDQENFFDILFEHFGSDAITYIDFEAGKDGPCGPQHDGGWCPQRVPTPFLLDTYLLRVGDMDPGQDTYMYFTIIDSIKDFKVQSSQLSTPQVKMQGADVTPVWLSYEPKNIPAGVEVSGVVKAKNIFRERDFKSFGGNFEEFVKFIPIITLFDDTGNIKAGGLVTPPPEVVGEGGSEGDEIDKAIAEGNWKNFLALSDKFEWRYGIRGVPEGKYTMVGTTPNYPAFSQNITVGADGKVVNIDWDKLVGQGSTIQGLVTDADGNLLENAKIVLESRGIKSKKLLTDQTGAFLFEGLGAAKYKITVIKDGYAPVAQAVRISRSATSSLNFSLTLAPGTISGTVNELVMGDFGPVLAPVLCKIIAYNDTLNVQDPSQPLAIIRTKTDSSGNYTLRNLIEGDVYKVFAKADGRYMESQDITVRDDVIDIDFQFEQKPLTLEIVIRKEANNFAFIIANTNNFSDGSVFYYPTSDNFGGSSTVEISNTFEQQPNGDLKATVDLGGFTSGVSYTLRVVGVPKDESANQVFTTTFGLDEEDRVRRNIDQALSGDDTKDSNGRPENEVGMADAANPTAIVLEPGAAILGAGSTIPTAEITAGETTNNAADTTKAAGATYTVDFTDINLTGKSMEIVLPYDPNQVPDLESMAIYSVASDGTRSLLSENVSVDAISGAVAFDADVANLLGSQVDIGGGQKAFRVGAMMANNDGKKFIVNPHAATSGSVSFVVGLTGTGATNTNGKFKSYNYPNPFDLKTKTVGLRSGSGSLDSSIRGTYIVVALGGSTSTQSTIKIRIYNAAGDMVREMTGSGTNGRYNYFHWDGRNTAANDVASGVYFAVVDAPGAPNEKPVKMVLVK